MMEGNVLFVIWYYPTNHYSDYLGALRCQSIFRR